MQKLMTVLGLLLSITGELFAQQRVPKEMTTAQYQALSPEERLFTRAPHSIGIDYTITLDRGNKLIMSLANGHDLHTFENINSLLTVFLSDLKPLRDSLADPMTIKRIDYLIDTSGHKKMRILQNRPTGTSFLVGGNEPALLKIAQDTINILIVTKVARHGEGKNVDGLRYDRLCFLLNRYSELDAYTAGGLNDTVHTILSGIKEPHHPYLGPFFYTYRSPTIKPFTHYGNGLLFSATADIQNYRNYFVPSFTLNGAVNLMRDRNNYIIGAFWQPLFFSQPTRRDRCKRLGMISSASTSETITPNTRTGGSRTFLWAGSCIIRALISTISPPFHSESAPGITAPFLSALPCISTAFSGMSRRRFSSVLRHFKTGETKGLSHFAGFGKKHGNGPRIDRIMPVSSRVQPGIQRASNPVPDVLVHKFLS